MMVIPPIRDKHFAKVFVTSKSDYKITNSLNELFNDNHPSVPILITTTPVGIDSLLIMVVFRGVEFFEQKNENLSESDTILQNIEAVSKAFTGDKK